MSAYGYFDTAPAYTDLGAVLSFDLGCRLLRGQWALRQVKTNRHYHGQAMEAQRREREQTLARRAMEGSFACVEMIDTAGLHELPNWLDELTNWVDGDDGVFDR